MPSPVHPDRVRPLNAAAPGPGPVLYWMRRDQRARDNDALRRAWELAAEQGAPLGVCFALGPDCLGVSRRHDRFLLNGLAGCARELAGQGIPFFLLTGDPGAEVPALAARVGAGAVVADYSPLRPIRRWSEAAAHRLDVLCEEVDAHNVVPVWRASDRREYAARTLRPKLRRLLPAFLTEPVGAPLPAPAPWPAAAAAPDPGAVSSVSRAAADGRDHDVFPPGEGPAGAALAAFLRERLEGYDRGRNDAAWQGQSDLSPYLRFGQLAPRRAAWEAQRAAAPAADRDAFLEELIVRRELADNFCHHEPRYDTWEALPEWGRRTLDEHADDPREHVYDLGSLEAAATHDPLWNAAQQELLVRGKMHGYLRMYWAKMILAWSPDPEAALQAAITLNDRYELDGRDPNGYVGCAWSVGGLHDRPWPERPVFGKVRAMSANGCRRKFRVDRYIERVQELAREADG
ncbi:MAG: deoxyribodipyrimidine photo-lyase [Candidatus Krumholzibacteriia bacterium]